MRRCARCGGGYSRAGAISSHGLCDECRAEWRWCARCARIRERGEFYGGGGGWCRDCRREYGRDYHQATYQGDEEARERIKERSRMWRREQGGEWKEKERARSRGRYVYATWGVCGTCGGRCLAGRQICFNCKQRGGKPVCTWGVCEVCGERCLAGRQTCFNCNPDKRSGQWHAREIRKAMTEAQGGMCALCGGVLREGDGQLDHDHRCCPVPAGQACGGCYRGVLHKRCNTLLACCGDDVGVLEAAIEFLRRPAAGTGGVVGRGWVCTVCGGPISGSNAWGICQRSEECKAARLQQIYKARKSGGGGGVCGVCGKVMRRSHMGVCRGCRGSKFSVIKREMAESQGWMCAICGREMSDGWVMDHDHRCCPGGAAGACGGCYRGVVHRMCNVLIARAGEDVGVLRKAVSYLGRFSVS
jgi:Recombination endonuclease VII